jgi:outer membrane protein insertion porin family
MLFLLLLLLTSTHVWAQVARTCVFQGNRQYDGGFLQGLIAEQWEQYLATQHLSYVDDAAYTLLSHYRKNGYYFATVDYDVSDKEVKFVVEEHHPVEIKALRIVRDKEPERPLSYPDERLRQFLTPPPLTGAAYFNKLQVMQDQGNIVSFYLSEGYLEAGAQVRYKFRPEPPEATEVTVDIAVNEGSRFYLDSVVLQGNRQFTRERLIGVIAFKPETVFTPGLHQTMTAKLRGFYREQGYARVHVKSEVRDVTKTVARQGREIVFTITEGELHYIRHISVTGNEETDTAVIMRQLDIAEGDVYDSTKIVSSKQNISNTKLFGTMEIEEQFVGTNRVDLVVKVVERDSRSLTFNLGYDTTYGVTGGIVYESFNLFGSYRRLTCSLDSTIFGGELSKSEAAVEISDPQLLASRVWSGKLRIFGLHEETPSYTLLDRGGRLTFEHKFSKELSVQFGYEMVWSQILDLKAGASDQSEGTTFFSTLFEKIILNLRDNDGYPTSGSYHFVEMEQSLTTIGAELDYFKFYLHNALYLTIIDKCVLAFALRGGVIRGFNDTETVPIQKLYFAGGVDSVRSFKTKEMPPLNDEDKPTGGEGIFLCSVELRIPVYANLGLSLFGDSGQIIPKISTLRDYRISHLKYAVGTSIWYNTPIGPLRVDFGINPDREKNPLTGEKEALFAWFLSIGFSF